MKRTFPSWYKISDSDRRHPTASFSTSLSRHTPTSYPALALISLRVALSVVPPNCPVDLKIWLRAGQAARTCAGKDNQNKDQGDRSGKGVSVATHTEAEREGGKER